MTDSKAWYASKTIWANLIALIAAVGVAFGFDLGLTAEVQSEIVVGILAIVNVGLRFATTSAITKPE